MDAKGKRSYTVLVVDDSKDDRFFIREVINRFPRFSIVGEARDGEEAISYLSGFGAFAEREKYPLPDLVLLDLKMPKRDGFDVLKWLRTKSFPEMTVIVLSTSALGEDIGASLALGAHGYWTKVVGVEKQNTIVGEIESLLDKRQRAAVTAS